MIFLSTYGVVFLGTPHRGSPQAGLGILVANVCRAMLRDANTRILRSLEQDSEVLERIREAFERMMTREGVKAYSFVEELPTVGVGMVGLLSISNPFPVFRAHGKIRSSRGIQGKLETPQRARGIYMQPTKI